MIFVMTTAPFGSYRVYTCGTRFLLTGIKARTDAQVSACGPPGSLIIYNGSVWHGHGANKTSRSRRSIQGAYIRRAANARLVKLNEYFLIPSGPVLCGVYWTSN